MKARLKDFFCNKLSKKMRIIISAVLVVVLVGAALPFTASADMVEVYNLSSADEHLNLDYRVVWSEATRGGYPEGELAQAMGSYTLTSNAWGFWFEADAFKYAALPEPVVYNAGDESVLTFRMSIEYWAGKQLGIMVRRTDDADSQFVCGMICEGKFRLDWRNEKAGGCSYSYLGAGSAYKHIKLVINKRNGKCELFGKADGDINDDTTGWESAGSKVVKWLMNPISLQAGIVLTTNGANFTEEAKVSNFSVNYMAPEGYEVETEEKPEGGDTEGTESGDSSTEEDTTPKIELPPDLEAAGDALLYESFTDDNILPKDDAVTVSNPLWRVRTGTPRIELNDSQTNRYLAAQVSDDPLFLEVGDYEWTDYTAQWNFSFTEDVSKSELNRINFLFRQRSAYAGGIGYYSVCLRNEISNEGGFAGQYLELRVRQGGVNIGGWVHQTGNILLKSVCLSETEMMESGETHTLKVRVFDNKIKIYLDDMTTPIIEYTDNRTGGEQTANEPHLMGGIGITIEEADVQIDEIIVRKLNDPLGGDYDNSIMGDYDEPIPDWLIENGYVK